MANPPPGLKNTLSGTTFFSLNYHGPKSLELSVPFFSEKKYLIVSSNRDKSVMFINEGSFLLVSKNKPLC